MKKKPVKRTASATANVPVPARKRSATVSSLAPLTEQQFKALLLNNESIIALLSKKKQLLYLSDSATAVTGWTAKDLQGAQIKKEFIPMTWIT